MWEFESFKLSLPLYYNINTDFPVNLLKSLEWLFLALKEFDPYSLCSEYLKYIDKNTSKKLFKEIQRNSSFESQYLNAIIFFTGAGGLETDNTKGWEIIQNESKRGNYYAQYSWANVLLNNATPNYAEAEKLLKSASESDYKFAKKRLEEIMKQKPESHTAHSQSVNSGDTSSAKPQGILKKLFG